MTFAYKQFTIHQDHAAMKVGTDSDLLGTLAAGGKEILDIGTGTGIIALMMAQRFPDARITAIEIDDDAVKDATVNFASSPFADRITLIHTSFQEFVRAAGRDGLPLQRFDCVVCNPPYFDRSTECPDRGRTRARHTSSLPFSELVGGAFALLKPDGVFSVCIPPEVLSDFNMECVMEGFWAQDTYRIKSLPEKEPKRYVLVNRKGRVLTPRTHDHCMRNTDKTRSEWYRKLMSDFLL